MSEARSSKGSEDSARGRSATPAEHPDSVRNIALEYKKGRSNAFFDGKAFLANAVKSGQLRIETLKEQLLSTQDLEALPSSVRYISDKPPVVFERMAMIDTLEALAEDDSNALNALVEVGLSSIDSKLAAHVTRAVVAEKYDVFAALARTNWSVAKNAFGDLDNKALADLLKPALIGGLVDSGIPREQAVSAVEKM